MKRVFTKLVDASEMRIIQDLYFKKLALQKLVEGGTVGGDGFAIVLDKYTKASVELDSAMDKVEYKALGTDLYRKFPYEYNMLFATNTIMLETEADNKVLRSLDAGWTEKN